MPLGAIALGAALLGWLAYGTAYALWAQARFPATGPFVRTPGGRLHVRTTGEAGPAVVLLHDTGANARDMAPIAALLGQGVRTFAIDRPGAGHTPTRARQHRLARQAETIAAALTAREAAPAVIVAHGTGCAVALRLALDHPEAVTGLVLIAPLSHPFPGAPTLARRLAAAPFWGPLTARLAAPILGPLAASGALARAFAPGRPAKAYGRASGLALAFRPRALRAAAIEQAALRDELVAQYFRYPEIEAPAVIITADRDAIADPAIHAAALARTLERAELITTPGAGHMPHWLRPEAAAAAVSRVQAMAGEPPRS